MQVARALLAAAVAAATAGCADSASGRWASPTEEELSSLAAVEPLADDAVTDDATAGDRRVVIVDRGPVVAASQVRTTLRGADVVAVVADRAGRVTRRLPSPGDGVASGGPVIELAAQPDPADELRLQILELERQLAVLEGRADDAARIEADVSAIRTDVERAAGAVIARTDGILSHHLVGLFESVDVGTEVAMLATSSRTIAVVDLGDDAAALAVGDTVQVEALGAGTSSSHPSTIEAIDGTLLTIAPPPDPSLTIGTRVSVSLNVPTDAALRIDERAIRDADGGSFVVIVTDDGRWERVPVEVGARGDALVEVIDPTGRVVDGTAVILP